MLLMSYTNISPSFILILSSIQEKQIFFLICSNIHVDAINFEVSIHKKNNLNILKRNIFPSNKNFHLLSIKDFIIVEKIFW